MSVPGGEEISSDESERQDLSSGTESTSERSSSVEKLHGSTKDLTKDKSKEEIPVVVSADPKNSLETDKAPIQIRHSDPPLTNTSKVPNFWGFSGEEHAGKCISASNVTSDEQTNEKLQKKEVFRPQILNTDPDKSPSMLLAEEKSVTLLKELKKNESKKDNLSEKSEPTIESPSLPSHWESSDNPESSSPVHSDFSSKEAKDLGIFKKKLKPNPIEDDDSNKRNSEPLFSQISKTETTSTRSKSVDDISYDETSLTNVTEFDDKIKLITKPDKRDLTQEPTSDTEKDVSSNKTKVLAMPKEEVGLLKKLLDLKVSKKKIVPKKSDSQDEGSQVDSETPLSETRTSADYTWASDDVVTKKHLPQAVSSNSGNFTSIAESTENGSEALVEADESEGLADKPAKEKPKSLVQKLKSPRNYFKSKSSKSANSPSNLSSDMEDPNSPGNDTEFQFPPKDNPKKKKDESRGRKSSCCFNPCNDGNDSGSDHGKDSGSDHGQAAT